MIRPRPWPPGLAMLLAGLALAFPAASRAGEAPRWARDAMAAPAPAAGNADAIVLLDRTEIRLDARLGTHVRRRRVARVLHAAGVPLATGRLRVEPGGIVQAARIWVIGPDGLRGSGGLDQLVESQLSTEGYSDARTFAMVPRGVRSGDMIAQQVEWDEQEPFPEYLWLPQMENLPCARAELEIQLPSEWSADVYAYRLGFAPSTPQSNVVRVSCADLGMLPDEPRRPEDAVLIPRVFVRFRDRRGESAFSDWRHTAALAASMMRAPSSADACPAELRAEATAGDAVARLRDLSDQVQHRVRYVAIELGMQRWVPDRGDATWARRYGDCKDKAALLVGALASCGIEARVVLACTRDRWRVDPASPDLFQFNHAIVALKWPGNDAPAGATVTAPSGTRWTIFDPTDEYTPLGCMSDALGGTWALIADSTEGLVRLPPATPLNFARDLDARLGDTGDLDGRLTMWADGPWAVLLEKRLAAAEPAERRRRAGEYLKARWPQVVIDSCWVVASDRAGERLGVGMTFHGLKLGRASGADWLAIPPLLSGWKDAPPRDSIRTLPVEPGPVGISEETWTIELPAGLEPERRAPVEWKGPFAEYSSRWDGSSGRLRIERHLDLRANEIPADDYAEARAFWRAVYSGDHPAILLRPR